MDDLFDLSSLWDYILPPLIILCIWFVFIVVSIITYHCFVVTSNWIKIYDNCPRTEVNCRYVIRMITGDTIMDYNPKATTFRMEIIGPNNKRLSAFGIKPYILRKRFAIEGESLPENQQIIRFLLLRKKPLKNIVKVILNHNGIGGIYVFCIEIQEIESKLANITFVDKYIERHSTKTAKTTQAFPASVKEVRHMEFTENTPSKLLNFIEYIIFLWFVINLIPFFCITFIICFEIKNYDNEKSFSFYCQSYQNDVISSLMTAVLSSCVSVGITTATIIIFRFGIKSIDSTFCKGLRLIWLGLHVITGTTAGIGSVVFAILRFQDKITSEIVFWGFSMGFGYTFLTIIWLPILYLLGLVTGFFEPVILKADKGDKERSPKHVRPPPHPPKDKGPKQAKDKPEDAVSPIESDESIGDRYYAELMKNKGKVKSISKY